MGREHDVRRRRPLLAVFAAVAVGLTFAAVLLIVRISGQIGETSREFDEQAQRVMSMNYVHRESLVWQRRLGSLSLDRDFTDLAVRRGLLLRQMEVVRQLSDDPNEVAAFNAVRAEIATVDGIVDALAPTSRPEEFVAAWRGMQASLSSVTASLKKLYERSEEEFVASVAHTSNHASRSKTLLALLGGLLLIIGTAFALMLRHAIRTDFRAAYRALRAEMNERAAAEEALATREAHFRSLVQNSSDVITVLDSNGQIQYESASIERNLGFAFGSRVGASIFDVIDDAEALRHSLEAIEAPGAGPRTLELRMRSVDGEWRHMEATLTNLLDDSNVAAIVMNHRDISERKRLETELRRQALHDPLTGLANRALFNERVEEAIAASAGTDGKIGVALLDLDNFKHVNDTYGHGAGDELLKVIADRLLYSTRPEDLVARLGGDEFAILFVDLGTAEAARAAIDRVIETVSVPASIVGIDVHVGASLGLAVALGVEARAEELVRNADVAMYAAKGRGKGRGEMFHPAMREEVLARAQMEVDLTVAIERGALAVEYQPAVEMETGTIRSVEALVRWPHPVQGMLQPGAFIGLAEETGLIRPLGRWVLHEACRQAQDWRNRMPERDGMLVHVNLSPRQIADPDVVFDVRDALTSSGLPADRLVLEITESVLLSEGSGVGDVLASLRDLGVHLAIDDFGTGFSSLGYLRFLPVEMLKIDRTFVDDLREGTDPALLRAIIEMAHGLSLELVAEGVEDQAQVDILVDLGCSVAQGYHFAGPMRAEAIEKLLTNAGREKTAVADDSLADDERKALSSRPA